LTRDVGLERFAQFVFVQHFVLTFDERRHLLFFDERVLEQALHLAFGVASAQSEAEAVRRQMEKADSRGRNAKWRATQAETKLAEIEDTLSAIKKGIHVPEEVVAKHKKLVQQQLKSQTAAEDVQQRLNYERLKLSELSSRQAVLRSQYTDEFTKRFKAGVQIANSPLVVAAMTEKKCGVCGTVGDQISTEVNRRVKDNCCPFCGVHLRKTEIDPKDLAPLKSIDEELSKIKTGIDGSLKAISRQESELEAARVKLAENSENLENFEKENHKVIDALQAPDRPTDSLSALLSSYKIQIDDALAESQAAYQKRDEKKKDLRKWQKLLQDQYSAVEENFVPSFKALATHFLGLDLDIQMQPKSPAGLTLVLQVKSSPRMKRTELSESQRFFVDIALKMALAQFMSSPTNKATMYIDTPEGSLDIAYEKRAGEMFAKFTKQGHGIVMTANINTSRLLLAMAASCRASGMQLCQMTTWAELSEVQESEESLFADALAAIQAALAGK
jgi:DNA repair exonuclease SbcCD ATPase subunit